MIAEPPALRRYGLQRHPIHRSAALFHHRHLIAKNHERAGDFAGGDKIEKTRARCFVHAHLLPAQPLHKFLAFYFDHRADHPAGRTFSRHRELAFELRTQKILKTFWHFGGRDHSRVVAKSQIRLAIGNPVNPRAVKLGLGFIRIPAQFRRCIGLENSAFTQKHQKPRRAFQSIGDESPGLRFIGQARPQIRAAAAINFDGNIGIFSFEGVDQSRDKPRIARCTRRSCLRLWRLREGSDGGPRRCTLPTRRVFSVCGFVPNSTRPPSQAVKKQGRQFSSRSSCSSFWALENRNLFLVARSMS